MVQLNGVDNKVYRVLKYYAKYNKLIFKYDLDDELQELEDDGYIHFAEIQLITACLRVSLTEKGKILLEHLESLRKL